MSLTKFNLTRGNTSSSWFSFQRGASTVEPGGALVSPNVPRWGAQKGVAGLWGDVESLDQLSNRDRIAILAAGHDAGTSAGPLLVTLDGSSALRFSWTADLSKVVGRYMYGSTLPSGTQGPDIRSTRSQTSNFTDGVCYVPVTGFACFGTVIVVCCVYRPVLGTWQPVGTAVAWTAEAPDTGTPSGPEFSIFYDDTINSSEVNPAEFRLNTFACTGWYAPGYSGSTGQRPTEVIVPFVDYQNAPRQDVNTSPMPNGGRAYWFKLKRDNSGKYIPVTHVESGVTIPSIGVLDLPANAFWQPGDFSHPPVRARYMHIHAAGVTEYADGKWQVVVASGDEANSMIRVIVNNTADSEFYKPSNWTVINNWHGTIDTSLRIPPNAGTGSPLQDNGNAGNQFVGVGPGPTAGTLLLGGDAVGDGSWILTPGSMTSSSTPAHETLIGSAGARMNRPASFHMRADRADTLPRLVAVDETRSIVYDGPSTIGTLERAKLNDFAFSWQSGLKGTWGFVPQTGYQQNYFVIGEYIYLASEPDVYLVNSIIRRKLPPIIAGEPLQVGPGGRQWLVNSPITYDYTNNPAATMVIPCVRSTSGLWQQMDIGGNPVGALDPQPPVLANAVFRITKVRTHPATHLCYLGPTRDSASQPGVLPTGQALGLGLRAWVRSNSARQSDSPQRNYASPKRSCSVGELTLAWDSGIVVPGGPPYYVSLGDYSIVNDVGTWRCVLEPFQGAVRWDSGSQSIEQFFLRSAPPPDDADTDIYLAIGEFCQFGGETSSAAGVDVFGYPLPARTAGTSSYLVSPPELAAIEHTLTSSFTVLFAGIAPEDSWDQYSPSATGGIPTIPLLTIRTSDGEHFLTISAKPGGDNGTAFVASYQLTTQSGGPSASVDSFPFLRGRALLGAITYDPNDDVARVYLCHNGRYLGQTKLIGLKWKDAIMKQIRFGEVRSTSIARVGTFQWMGVAIDTSAIDEVDIIKYFQNLGFL